MAIGVTGYRKTRQDQAVFRRILNSFPIFLAVPLGIGVYIIGPWGIILHYKLEFLYKVFVGLGFIIILPFSLILVLNVFETTGSFFRSLVGFLEEKSHGAKR